jgi:hypothetical protein
MVILTTGIKFLLFTLSKGNFTKVVGVCADGL